MIVVEGPDGAGKTTLVRQICKEFGLREGERGTAQRELLYTVTRSDTYNALGASVRGKSPVYVWDRLFFSEFVYHELVGRPCEFNDTDRTFVPRVIDAMRCPVVLCLPPFDVVSENAWKGKQMDGVLSHLSEIWAAYNRMTLLPRHHFRYDYTAPNASQTLGAIMAEVEGYLQRRGQRTW